MELDPQTIIAQLNASSADRINALRLVKNDVVGDTRKKTLWVRFGLLPHIIRLLPSQPSVPQSVSEANKVESDAQGTPQALDFFGDETAQSIHLLALQLLSAFANGMITGSSHLLPALNLDPKLILMLHFLQPVLRSSLPSTLPVFYPRS
jgi:hypothetical protein